MTTTMQTEVRCARRTSAWVLALALGVAPACDVPGGGDDPAEDGRRRGAAQARWEVTSDVSGRFGDLGPRARKELRARRRELVRVVREVYAAAWLRPRAERRVVRARFGRRAARAFLESRLGPPDDERVRTTRRVLELDVAADDPRRGAARVAIVARVGDHARGRRVRHRATLWLERHDGRWRVIAFDALERSIEA